METTSSPVQQSKYRFVNLIVYVLAALVNSLPAQTFSSINSKVQQQFHFDKLVVTLNTLVFPILHPFFAFPTNWVLDKWGMKIGCSIGGILTVAGVWLRTLIQVDNPYWCFMGSIIAAIGNIFVLNSASKLPTSWFRPDVVPIVITVCVLANLISVTLGASLPGLLTSKKADASQIRNFLFLEAIVITIPIIIFIIFYRNKPSEKITFVEAKLSIISQNSTKKAYFQTLKELFTRIQYIKIMFCMTFSYGILIAMLATIQQTLSTLQYQDSGKITSLIILPALLVGIISSVGFSLLLRKNLQYRITCSVILWGSFFMSVLLALTFCVFQVKQQWLIVVISIFVGIFYLPQSSTLISYGSEVSYPLGEASSSGYQFAASQFFGFILGIVFIKILDSFQNEKWPAYVILVTQSVFFGLAAIIVVFTKNDLRRSKKKQQLQKIKQSFEQQNPGDYLDPENGQEADIENKPQQEQKLIKSGNYLE